VLSILRAESLSEVPVIGRMIAASDRRAHAAAGSNGADPDTDSGASLLPGPDDYVDPPVVGDSDPGERLFGSPAGSDRR
ncbi:MAG: hypothetical protein ACRDY1_09785, partial [Acidimicrobiales bacterium]